MKRNKLRFRGKPAGAFYIPFYKGHFFRFFSRKGGDIPTVRPGAMLPGEVKRAVEQIGEGNIVEILRIGYDGSVDDMPMLVEITRVFREGFSGKIVNVERQMIEESSRQMIYARRGGGIIDFLYSDGDIKEIKENRDADELSEWRDKSEIKDLLAALEIEDRILVAYYDKKHRGTVNVEGVLLSRSMGNKIFKIVIEKINGVELENKIEKQFDIDNDLVIDISLV
jgi:hypothetical protein